jgi:hypothetical protein
MSAIRSVRIRPWRFFAMFVAGILVFAVLLYLFFGAQTKEAEAQIAVLYSSTCLGGWKNADHAVGVPEVAGNSEVAYTDENSATLEDSMTQLFCGGFAGDIPDAVDRTKISLRFSWQMEQHETFQKERNNSKDSDYTTEIITIGASSTDLISSTTEETSLDQSTPAPVSEESNPELPAVPAVEEVIPVEEVTSETESVSWWRVFIPSVYAQEESSTAIIEPILTPAEIEVSALQESSGISEPEDIEVLFNDYQLPLVIASSTDVGSVTTTTATTTISYTFVSPVFDQNKDKDNALFEVLFTIDNARWHSLGYVSRINNDIAFELPVDMFPTVDDFSKLQIALESVERLDDTPKIYLDSMWVEVSYVGAGEDPLTPPGSLGGDIITSTYLVDNQELVTVFRNISLETISNILLLTASSSSSTVTVASSTNEVVLATSTEAALVVTSGSSSLPVIYEAPISFETKNILRDTPGVLVELWLHNKTEDTWMRVADNSAVSTVPRAVLIDKKVFWFGLQNSALWVFDTISQGYSSRSISPQTPVLIEYVESTGEQRTVWFNPKTEKLELMVSAI